MGELALLALAVKRGPRAEGALADALGPFDDRADLALLNLHHGVNMSGLIRSLIDDHLSESKITLAVSEETAHRYQQIVSHTGSTDAEIEPYLRTALKRIPKDRIAQMEKLQRSIK